MASSRWEMAALVLAVAVGLGAAARGFNSFSADRARDAKDYELREWMFDAVQPVNVTNCRLARFGDAHDGGYLVCGNLLGTVQTAYSYGIAGTDGWGCQVSKTLNVPVHEYDCFDLRRPSCPDGRLIFHAECVGPTRWTEEERVFDSIGAQVDRNGDRGKPMIMKMDVEGAEWDAFLATPDDLLDRIDQLIVEFHGVDNERNARTIEKLKGRFVFAHLHFNNYSCKAGVAPFPAPVFEALLVNKRIAQTGGTPAARAPQSNLDAPNNPNAPDCQG